MRRSRCQSMVVSGRVDRVIGWLPKKVAGAGDSDGIARKECVPRVVSCHQYGTLILVRKRPTEA